MSEPLIAPDRKTHGQQACQQFWQQVMELQQASGLSLNAFCKVHHLTYGNAKRWRQRLRSCEPGQQVSTPPEVAMDFVPVKVAPFRGEQTACFELCWGSAYQLRIPPHVDAESLTRVLTVLQVLPC